MAERNNIATVSGRVTRCVERNLNGEHFFDVTLGFAGADLLEPQFVLVKCIAGRAVHTDVVIPCKIGGYRKPRYTTNDQVVYPVEVRLEELPAA